MDCLPILLSIATYQPSFFFSQIFSSVFNLRVHLKIVSHIVSYHILKSVVITVSYEWFRTGAGFSSLYTLLPSWSWLYCCLLNKQKAISTHLYCVVSDQWSLCFVDKADARAEDGSRSGGLRPRWTHCGWCGREHSDSQSLWPARAHLEPWLATETGKHMCLC